MRKTILSIIFLLILLAMPTMVFAAEGNVAQVGEETFADFEEALEAAKSNGEDVVILKTINVNSDLTFTLDGFNITGQVGTLFSIQDGSMKIEGTGTISAPNGDAFSVIGNMGTDYETVAIDSTIEIGASVTVTAKYNCIYIKGNGAKADVYGILTSPGEEYATIQGNGNPNSGGTIINIYKGASVLNDNNHAIYHPQEGELNIFGGTIKGVTGLEIRAGKLVVEKDATIIGTYNGVDVEPNGNGTTTKGSGIAIAQHTTEKAIDVVVNGGNIQGYYAIHESNPEKNASEVISNVAISINDGKFETLYDGPSPIYSENNTKFVACGTFNKDVEEKYLVESVTSEKDANGNYVVGTRYNVVIKETTNGTVTSSKETALEGEKVKLTVTPDMDYELSKLTVLNADNKEIEVVDGEFVMPAGGVTVKAEFSKIIPPMDYIVSGNETENNNIGVVEPEKTVETLDASLKADTELNKKVEEERQKGNQVTVEITMDELDNKDVKEEEKQKILETVKENQTVHQYFDISVLVKTNEKELGKLTQLTEKMKFSMEISKDLIQEGRKFYILKVHGDEVERIEAVLNGTKLEFETDQFSTFALAYEDATAGGEGESDNSGEVPGGAIEQPKEEVNVPNTGDNIVLYIALALIAVVGIVLTKKVNTKKNKN